MAPTISRRTILGGAVAIAAGAVRAQSAPEPFRFCLNSSTVRDRGQHRPLEQLVEIAAKAGYAGIEPWIAELDAHQKSGRSLKDLAKRITDAGLVVPSVIGFAEWIVDDDERRRKGFDTAKRDMEWARDLGCQRIAAPPIGATRAEDLKAPIDLLAAADRYRALLDLGQSFGVTPMLEIWGFSKTLRRLGEAWLIAAECGRAGACLLPDVYHLYKGGSDFEGLKLLAPAAIGIVHINDYPKLDRAKITDADRVYPGDGIAPLADILKTLRQIDYTGFLSIELFNRDYWKQDPLAVAKTARSKLQSIANPH